MDIHNRRALKQMAGSRLAKATYHPGRLALIHTAVGLGAAFLVTLIGYLLNMRMEQAGGLSGMGMRSLLGTVQTTLQYIVNLAMPFWEMGFIYAALQMARGEWVGPQSLTEGFRRFGPVLRLRLMVGLIYAGAAFACAYICSFLFVLTPMSQPMMDLMMPMMEAGADMEALMAAVEAIPQGELIRMMVPYLVIFGIHYLAVALFLCYRFRFANFIVMDEPGTGALRALRGSRFLARRRGWALLKLDLSFWWFYLLLGVAVVVSFGDELLKLAGIALPISEDVAYLVFYLLGILVQLVLFRFAYSHVQTTWAVAYEELRQAPEVETVQRAPVQTDVPKALPWEENE